MTCEADFYFSIRLAFIFTDDPSCWSVLGFTRDAVKFPAIKRLGVKRDWTLKPVLAQLMLTLPPNSTQGKVKIDLKVNRKSRQV